MITLSNKPTVLGNILSFIAAVQSLEANLSTLITSGQNNHQESCPVIESLGAGPFYTSVIQFMHLVKDFNAWTEDLSKTDLPLNQHTASALF